MFLSSPTDFDGFVNGLARRLKQPLPGLEAQLKLLPAYRAELRRSTQSPADARQSAVLILLFPESNDVKTVFIQRNIYDGVHSGQVAFPGGRFEKGDKDLEKTALRETEEEVGVPSSRIRLIGKLTKIYIPPSNFDVLPFVGCLAEPPTLIPDPSEVSGVFTVSLNHLIRPESCQMSAIDLPDGRQIDAPCYLVDNYRIWGATSMILSEFIEVLKEVSM